MQEQLREEADGTILFDAEVSPQVDADWFDPDYWRGRDALHVQQGGRGGVALIRTPAGECVLRHYRRGGLVARLLGDRYRWGGANRTRPFAEFRLLAAIVARGLPGPLPVAARFCRRGGFYTADLITRRIDAARTLAEYQGEGRLDAALAESVGVLVARFHREGIWHADLNAHNVLVTPAGLYLIDFDRGRLRPLASRWRLANLRRLRRSLLKVAGPGHELAVFERDVWQPLLNAYQRTFAV
ncbi:3-deoxy-D-manno-octulosonic acid kinase [Dyella sp. A6]|uniref:3-deoxy-D-manno-octulosonic acid kinase n=1 Tax=Dyella aluminiiresistens TaxID=3069105 RepID=UPI002E75FB10|nr:3-deoxy-D-manno-octulosonic acid kinase [Dyella sp. A6]